MQFITIAIYGAALLLFMRLRPLWRTIGPSLLDAFVIGISLFAIGSVLVWLFLPLPHAQEIMQIGLVAGISSALAASLWSVLFASKAQSIRFVESVLAAKANPEDQFAINAGLIVCSVVCIWFLTQVFLHEHLRQLLLATASGDKTSFNQARLIMSSGVEGYFAPGYVKQFRDIAIPILCTAALLYQGTYRARYIFYPAIIIALIAMFVSGQRLVILVFMLCLGCGFVANLLRPTPGRLMPVPFAIPIFLGMGVLVIVLTQLLGRAEIPLTPTIEQPAKSIFSKKFNREDFLKQQEDVTKKLGITGWKPVDALVQLAHRAVMAVPQENALSYPAWADAAPTFGRGWIIDLGGLRFGTQQQFSNELSAVINYGAQGNSPLAAPTDLYYNWGLVGVVVFTALYALLFFGLDLGLSSSCSPLLWAAKLFLFVSIPFMYSPYLFLLYGGAVVVALVAYVQLRGVIRSMILSHNGRS